MSSSPCICCLKTGVKLINLRKCVHTDLLRNILTRYTVCFEYLYDVFFIS